MRIFPQGMPRNTSESHLVQIGSKALSNVAGQFSKLSQSLTPKIRTGKKLRNNSNPHIVYNPSAIAIDQGIEHELNAEHSKDDGEELTDSDDNDCSIYEPDHLDLVEQNPIYNENAFMPGVGIVMAQAEIYSAADQKGKTDLRKMSADGVSTLEKPPTSVRSLSPAPEIHIQEIDDGKKLNDCGGQKLCHSAVEMRIDAMSPGESR